ncbi:MAG: DEAD/DEAH box helicase family protein, partial [Acholeplasmataceae bacterium]
MNYQKFLAKKSNDVIDGVFRPEIRTRALNDKNQELMDSLKVKSKDVELNNLSSPIENPFELLKFTEKSDLQKLVDKHSDVIRFHGNFMYTASAGDGKTVAGLFLIYKLQCRTLIISSRNSVNDQWIFLLRKLYPNLKITNLDSFNPKEDYDIYVFTPQYLANKPDLSFMKISLIIYDEIHSLLSDVFIKVLEFPFQYVIKEIYSELPYMISLSATLPLPGTSKSKFLRKIFGKEFRTKSKVVKIPIDIYETRSSDNCIRALRKMFKLVNSEIGVKYGIVTLVKNSQCGDTNDYSSSKDHQCSSSVKSLVETSSVKNINESLVKDIGDCSSVKNISEPLSKDSQCNSSLENHQQYLPISKVRGIIMTYTVDSSIYAALHIRKIWKCDVLIVRAVGENCILVNKDYDFDETITYKQLKENIDKIGFYCDVNQPAQVIVGCLHRLSEGFSIQNITWGICTKF